MRGLGIVCALGCLLIVPARHAAGQAERDFQPLREWDTELVAGRTRPGSGFDTVVVDGTIRSRATFSDVVLRFEYRPVAPSARSLVFVREGFDDGGRMRGYSVALDAGTGRGQLRAEGRALHEERYDPPSTNVAPGQWVACELRLEGDRLTVRLDGALVAVADRLDATAGYLGFSAAEGGVELRDVRTAVPERSEDAFSGLAIANAPGVTPPTVIHQEQPHYTASAMRAGISGVVLLEVVVDVDGRVTHLRVKASPDPDLAVAAADCARKWRFKPALKDGAPVPVVATIEMAFSLGTNKKKK
jgi:TonB family protein